MTAGTYRYKTEFGRRFLEGRTEDEPLVFTLGKALAEIRGEAKALLLVLRSRGIAVDAAIVARVKDRAASGDIGRLEVWLERAATAESADEIFGRRRPAVQVPREESARQ
ncbi:hypothetical protein [Nocardia concava]|uniref:hypothetical protein n=1 Tax=Nocardia concava TaxID=257281 RepID=UPI000594E201|nr:hypothetical protein [Nocardia concava]